MRPTSPEIRGAALGTRIAVTRTDTGSRGSAGSGMRGLGRIVLLLTWLSGISTAAPSAGQAPAAGVPPPPQNSAAAMGGSTTGGAHPAVLDAQRRPITAGGFVKTGPSLFEEIARQAGLTAWAHRMGSPDKSSILDTVGSGVALLDFDRDGWLDIYLVNGSTAAAEAGKAPPPHAALFRNNHDGTFTDVAGKAGVNNDRWGFGAVAGDFDNDGWPDLYVTNFGRNRLYHNNGDGTFTDVAEKAGVALAGWSTGATWGDYDGDGFLDLFVPGYVHVAAGSSQTSAAPEFCLFRGIRVMCGPRGLPGEPDHLFRNNGNGTFTDVSLKTGTGDLHRYYGLASLFVDLNGDGRPDLVVADDSTPNYLYLNRGDGTFEDASYASGYALNGIGRETASMGIGAGDLSHDGRIDLYNTVFSDDYNVLYRNDGDGNFTDTSFEKGIAEATFPFLGWGTALFDYDNDGWLDIMVANGHVYPQVDAQPWGTSFAQRPLLFHNNQGSLALVPAKEGTGLASLSVARGLAVGDLFNDGHLDVVLNNMDQPPSLLRNVAPSSSHWIAFRLTGTPATAPGKHGSPRDAVGASVYVTANGIRQRADVLAGGSFASCSDTRLHFGLGAATRIDKIDVRWPSGRAETIKVPEQVDAIYDLVEGAGVLSATTHR